MNLMRLPLRRLSLGVALALAMPGLALAQQDDRYQTDTEQQPMQEQRDLDAERYRSETSGDSKQMSTDIASTDEMASSRRQQLMDRPGQSAKDARREAIVWTSYELNDQLKNADIDVEVRSGRAMLSGTVESQVERDLAEQIAQSVDGIDRVDNQIRVDRNFAARSDDRMRAGESTTDQRDFATALADATTTAKVKSKLLWNSRTDGLDIDVDTRQGRVTLTGTADTQQSKQLAERIARDTEGVSTVSNQLSISADSDVATAATDPNATMARDDRTPMTGTRDAETFESDFERSAATDEDSTTAIAGSDRDRMDRSDDAIDRNDDMVDMERPDSWITTKVKSTLLFSRSVDGFDIEVDTRDGVVMLSGNVDTEQEKQAAVNLAQDIQGVRRVDAARLSIGDEPSVAGSELE